MASEQQKLKKKLDGIFSKYVRLINSDSNGFVGCYTCGKLLFWKQIQNGHYVPRNTLATRFSEDNCRPQCIGCNLFGNGKFIDFRINLVREIGTRKVNSLEREKFKVFKIDSNWYTEKIIHYTKEVKRLLEEKRLDDKPKKGERIKIEETELWSESVE